MENSDTFKEALKMVIKSRLKGTVADSFEKHSAELIRFIQNASDNVASKILDETKIEEIADAARQGATYMAISALVKQTAEDAIKEAAPMLSQVSEEFNKIVAEATLEAIMELITERLQDKS